MLSNGNKRPRLIIDVTPELRRRIKVAAAASDLSVREYVVRILESAVPAEDRLASERSGTLEPAAVERLLQTRAAIMRGRRFADDSVDLIEQARAGRMAEL